MKPEAGSDDEPAGSVVFVVDDDEDQASKEGRNFGRLTIRPKLV